MPDKSITSIEVHFSDLPDPRTDKSRIRHKLMDMIVIAICAVICGADNWVAVESFGHAKSKWLSGLLKLPNGIPSHDTFSRVFGLLDSVDFEHCFINWIKQVIEVTDGQVVAIDGKHLRGSYDTATDQSAIRLVSAWASAPSVTLGQLKVAESSNEIPTMPQLLELLTLSGCIVTTDAMGCHPQIAQQIVDCDADYVLALKANQGQLHEDVKLLFDGIADNQLSDVQTDTAQTIDGDHGRIETRMAISVADPALIAPLRGSETFVNLNSVVKITAQREHNGQTTIKSRYYISSLPSDATQLLNAIRTHWSIENSCHWVLDVAFNEDGCRIRKENGTQNFAILRRIALNLLKGEPTAKVGVATKRLKAAWDTDYLTTVLATLF